MSTRPIWLILPCMLLHSYHPPSHLSRLQEWEYAKVRQDAQLERIERGIGTLGDMAKGMQEELDKQNPVIDDIDTQLNKVTGQLKTNNAKLKGLITQVSCGHVLLAACMFTLHSKKYVVAYQWV